MPNFYALDHVEVKQQQRLAQTCLASDEIHDLHMHEAPIQATATVIQVLGPGLFELELPNGKRNTGHLSKKLRGSEIELTTGQKVTVELTPFDFDTARIIEVAV